MAQRLLMPLKCTFDRWFDLAFERIKSTILSKVGKLIPDLYLAMKVLTR